MDSLTGKGPGERETRQKKISSILNHAILSSKKAITSTPESTKFSLYLNTASAQIYFSYHGQYY